MAERTSPEQAEGLQLPHWPRWIRALSVAVLVLALLWLAAGTLTPLGCRSSNDTVAGLSYLILWRGHRYVPFGRSSLVRALKDPDPGVRAITAAVIGKSGIVSASGALVVAFESEPDWEARDEMAEAMISLRETSVVPSLVPIALQQSPRQNGVPWTARPRLARRVLAEITGDPELEVLTTAAGRRSTKEEEQISIVREWWVTHRAEHIGD